ncbi:MAG TPA: zf-HC2 domain-containing protein [Candidatus Paceibacterota bacterium]|nr:zf-HC2 domain-containing protein [Verrucomicrobiota bacterium]HRY51598.1 zf-HC2 domain-containing protein [Candidatus Paceibacterota bacterium]HSA03388.1 zf-HC2 domain-containing protein [Candidatus Paceibacterota bacterium]
MKCTEIESLLGAYLDSELDARSTREIQLHLDNCPLCTRTLKINQAFEQQLRSQLKAGPKTLKIWEREHQFVLDTLASANGPDQAPNTSAMQNASRSGRRRGPLGHQDLAGRVPLRSDESDTARHRIPLASWIRELLWPSPTYYLGLAALWIVLLIVSLPETKVASAQFSFVRQTQVASENLLACQKRTLERSYQETLTEEVSESEPDDRPRSGLIQSPIPAHNV